MKTRQVPIADLHPYPGNPKLHDVAAIRASLRANGQYRTVVVREPAMTILCGHGTVEAAEAEGWKKIRAELIECDDETARRIVLVDNRTPQLAGYDESALLALLQDVPDFDGTGYTPEDLQALLAGPDTTPPAPTLAERFGVPPFSVLDARQGPWIERKRRWLALGIQSEVGRPQNSRGMSGVMLAAESGIPISEHGPAPNRSTPASHSGNDPRFYVQKKEVEARLGRELSTEEFLRAYYGGTETYATGTSIFDPVLTELLLRWFAPPGARVLDPFAGGSVRGIVAALLGHSYVGIDLSQSQVEANRAQGVELVGEKHAQPEWIVGDSARLLAARKRDEQLRDPFDFVMTCPPYADLERYSDAPADLSAMPHDEFAAAYYKIIAGATKLLAPERFAAIVIGNIRRKDGSVWDLGSLTTDAMEAAGLSLYNDAILVTSVGSLALRAARIFAGGRKLARTHQLVLVYCKGTGKKADAALGKLSEESYAVPVLADDED